MSSALLDGDLLDDVRDALEGVDGPLERAIDKFENVANIVEQIAVKES